MRRDLLEYPLPKHIPTHWQNKEWLREMDKGANRLGRTKTGVDVCRGMDWARKLAATRRCAAVA